MGRSNSIAEQAEKNQKFQEYLAAQQKAMEEHVAKSQKDIDAAVKKHYTPYPDDALLLAGQYSHLSTVSEWSADSLNTVLDSVKGSLFGKPVPAGSTKPAETPEVSTAVAALGGLELLVANAAFDLIQGVLQSLGTSTSTNISAETKNKAVAPGLMLFVSVLESSFKSTDFFNSELIVQNIYVYEVHFSIKEGQAVSHLSDLQSYEDQKQTIRNSIKLIDDRVGKLVPGDDLDAYTLALNKLNTILDALDTRLGLIDGRIKQLTGAPVAAAAYAIHPMHAMPPMPKVDGQAIPYLKQKCERILAAN